MITDRLKKQLAFMLELDKMKNIYRQTYVLHEDRKENDAEHSWHIAVMAFLLEEYADSAVDTFKVMKMLLVHDVVEIDAGDTYGYDTEGYKTKADREEKSAQRIFGILPEDQKKEFYGLWREFEDGKTNEAKFANVLDRIQPMILNYMKGGISWQEHGIYSSQVAEKNRSTAEISAQLAEVISKVIEDSAKKGWLKI
ncbi:MAG: HD domain-containing protein [Ruminococcus flavefaciens]|nr:HD domain-containing protein [Ruminococcus flavefaciens]